MRHYALTDDGRCRNCGAQLPGVYDGPAGRWGAQRLPVQIA
jgi:pyruvate formate lyase activating enzyme